MQRFALSTLAVLALLVVPTLGFQSSGSAQTPEVTLTPGPQAVDVRAGTDQIVIAYVRRGDDPVANAEVAWDVASGPNAAQAGVATSNTDGVARIAVNTDALVPLGGSDVLRAWIDTDNSGAYNEGEPHFEVTLTTLPSPNGVPVAVPQAAETPAGEPLDITLSGSDPDNQRIGYSITRMPEHGSVPAFLTGPFVTYTPSAGFTGEDSFEFGVTDSEGATGTATVSIRVVAPTAPATCEGKPATIEAQAGQTVVIGTDGPDVIAGSDRAENIYGLGGDDTICGNGGNDVLYGSHGTDVLVLTGEGGVAYAGDGDDTVHALGKDAWVFGGNGNDTMNGGDPVNHLYGSDGDDTISVGNGASVVSGGNGNDRLSTTGEATLWGGTGLDHMTWPGRERRD